MPPLGDNLGEQDSAIVPPGPSFCQIFDTVQDSVKKTSKASRRMLLRWPTCLAAGPTKLDAGGPPCPGVNPRADCAVIVYIVFKMATKLNQ